MGLAILERLGAGTGGVAHRARIGGLSALLGGVAAVALSASMAHAQQANTAQQADTAQPQQKQEDGKATTSGETLLDKILLISRTGETAIESLSSSSHVDQAQLDRRMASTPNEMLFGVPGVAVQADARRASSSINIRGLQDFGRVAVILDGARQNFQRSSHGTQSTFYIDPELIKSVDIIRGPVANTYGSGAIGGVVMFDTKDARDFLKPEESWATSLTGRYETNGKGWTTSATGAYRFSENFDVLGNIVYRDFSDYKDGGGDKVAGSGFDVLSGLLKTTIKPSDNSELKLGWVGANDGWTEGDGNQKIDVRQDTFTARYSLADPDNPWLDLHINGSANKTSLDRTYLAFSMYPGSNGALVPVLPGTVASYDLTTYNFDIWNTSRFETGSLGHELTYGGDWMSDDVDTVSAAGGSDIYTPSGTRKVWGAYIQDKISYDWLEIIAGLRYDSFKLESDATNNSGDRLSPRLTVGISPFASPALSGLQFYGTYAEGYRAPTITETLISGLHYAGPSPFVFLPNPDLKPETAKTVEFGANYRYDGVFSADDNLRLKATYFHNDVDGFIDLQPVGRNYQYQNYANAKIQGFELEGVYDAAWGFAALSASIIDGHTVTYGGIRDDLLTIPSAQLTGQLGFRFLEDRLTVGGEVQFNGKPKGNDTAKDYTLVNAFASYKASDNFKLDFRVDNIFDVKYANPLNATATTPVYEPGVTLKLAATMLFGG